MPQGAPPDQPCAGALVTAPANWLSADFISDLHLQVGQHATFAAWQRYMASTPADALFILGDLFDAWVGDDITASSDPDGVFALQCQQVLLATALRIPVYFMHGNRDFLLGQDFARASGITLLADPTVLDFDGQRWLLSHGDALCLNDVDYLKFRQLARSPAWQQNILAKPLAERQLLARSIRSESESRKASGTVYADVDADAAKTWLLEAKASTLIHGHTHLPNDHVLDAATQPVLRRIVLSDWDAAAEPPRLQVLRLQAGHAPLRLPLTSGL
jgi:UDP-2,3-diacylglucosamine hydrolase